MRFQFLFIFAVLFALTGCSHSKTTPPETTPTPKEDDVLVQKELYSLMELMEFARENYVDADKVTYQKLFQGAMDGMLNALDPYSSYSSPEDFKLLMESSNGKFAGIGATVQKNKDGTTGIRKVIKGKPADLAGLRNGDIILSADGFLFQDKPLDECVGKLRGEEGSSLILKIRRKNVPDKEYVLKRAVIKTPSITNMGVLQDKIGYLRINQFTATTADELDAYLKKYGKQIDRLIIDLRFNPGGNLDVTVEALSRFLEKGLLIVSVEGRAETHARHEAVSCKKYTKLPIAVLINEYSASASEIFSGCMKDYKRGVVIGEKSFGKGSVQRVFQLPDGGGVRLTIAKYYTPSRKVIHNHGVEPDIVVRHDENDDELIAEFFLKNEDAPPKIGENGYKDPQLERAVKEVKELKEFRMIR